MWWHSTFITIQHPTTTAPPSPPPHLHRAQPAAGEETLLGLEGGAAVVVCAQHRRQARQRQPQHDGVRVRRHQCLHGRHVLAVRECHCGGEVERAGVYSTKGVRVW
jgi:hypothetical protein